MAAADDSLVGEGLAPGRAAGPVWCPPPEPSVAGADLEAARGAAAARLRDLAGRSGRAADEAAILEAQADMLDDPSLRRRVAALVPTLGPVAAVDAAAESFARELEALDDPYLQARAFDVREVAGAWRVALAGAADAMASPPAPSVVVRDNLSVAWLLAQPPGRVLAIVARAASRTMHATLVAAGLGIPVVAVRERAMFERCRGARRLLVDGDTGRVRLEARGEARPVAAVPMRPGPVRLGRKRIRVSANASDPEEVRAGVRAGADGVALVRTEMAFTRAGRLLSVAEQEALYDAIAEAAAGRPVTFRTLDLGADKPLRGVTLPTEANPQLGLRGLRLARHLPALLDDQLVALARIGQRRPHVRVMFPMVAAPEDWQFARERAAAACGQAAAGAMPALGIMLEVPSAIAWLPELVAAGVGFLSIGTNDLTQYVLAQDRERADLTPPRVPVAVLRYLGHGLRPALRAGVDIAVCGALAADPLVLPLLVLIGADELGVPPARVAATRRALAALAVRADWRARLRPVLSAHSDAMAERLLLDMAWWLEGG